MHIKMHKKYKKNITHADGANVTIKGPVHRLVLTKKRYVAAF